MTLGLLTLLIALAGAASGLLAAHASPIVRDTAFVDSITWGVTPSSMAELARLGREKWLQQQLHPPPALILPKAAQTQIDALPLSQETTIALASKFDEQARELNKITNPNQKKTAQQDFQQGMTEIAREAAARSILRALYAPDQLRERMTWFWFNHFNVHQYKANVRVLVGDYEDEAIRPNALGSFRDLLLATLRHPAMLRYLDNADNAAAHLNENYARELMELHTMGVGSGYTQKDVEELARILTGVGIDFSPQNPKILPGLQPLFIRDGIFEFNPARHDFGDKVFLGHVIQGHGFGEVIEALDILCRQPATASHISREIATYFVSDNPPQALVERMSATFRRTNGDIAEVLNTLFHSSEFSASNGTKFKDPVRYIFSALRLAYDQKVILNTMPVQNWLNRLDEGLYNHQTPDGYPLAASAWSGPGQMTTRFEIARIVGSSSGGLFKRAEPDSVDMPAFPLIENELYFKSLQYSLSSATRSALSQAVSPQDWNTLFLSSPEFMH